MISKNELIISNDTHHDAAVAYIQDGVLKNILEYERISKFKHCEFQYIDIPQVLACFGLDKNNTAIIDKDKKYKYNNHHELHALGSFLSSGFNESCILVIDGSGDLNDCVTIFYGKDKNIKQVRKYDVQNSLGALYATASDLIYHSPNCEGKMMGLSCCSNPEYNVCSPIQFNINGDAKILYNFHTLDDINVGVTDYIVKNLSYLFDENNNILHSDVYKAKLAATVQWWFTEQVLNLVKYCKSLFPNCNNLCLAGGCFLNCETNGEIDKLNLFEHIYCPSAPADNGIILGKIQQIVDKPVKINTSYWGPNHNEIFEELSEIFFLHEHNGTITSEIDCIENISRYNKDWVIERLKQNRIILWFDGKSEFGPRALGHRSFLANPTTKEMFWNLSTKIKKRENYRPLAPITIDKLYNLIFEDEHPENLTQFMLKTVKIKPEYQQMLKAVVHVNQTARPQRLTKDVNSELYNLIETFYNETSIPCLINTSLNLKNHPLIETYNDLVSIFVNNTEIAQYRLSVVVNHCLCFDVEE